MKIYLALVLGLLVANDSFAMDVYMRNANTVNNIENRGWVNIDNSRSIDRRTQRNYVNTERATVIENQAGGRVYENVRDNYSGRRRGYY